MTADGEHIDPDPALVDVYGELRTVYADLYPALRETMTRLASFRRRPG